MSIDPRVTSNPWFCGWCRTTRPAGDVAWPITAGTTESSGCTDCAIDRDNLMQPRGENRP